MKMKHRGTGEIVFVIGYVAKPTKGVFARCLCDARLHPDRKGRGFGEDTVEMEIAAHMLGPVEMPNWKEIEALYPPTQFQQILKRKQEENIRNVNNNAHSVFVNVKSELIKNGMPADIAEKKAKEQMEKYIESRLDTMDGEKTSVKRPTVW